ncbi:MAG: hypothetical protein LBM16_01765 [Clostridiales bacterium]|jgi:hypothetical protein|nr:hypothetical protein [Clostridiales bacterium]
MSFLSKIIAVLEKNGVPTQTVHFTQTPLPDEYAVITPMIDSFEIFADNKPQIETSSARISIFTRGNFTELVKRISFSLIESDFFVTDRRYIGYEKEAMYHHYSIDTEAVI